MGCDFAIGTLKDYVVSRNKTMLKIDITNHNA